MRQRLLPALCSLIAFLCSACQTQISPLVNTRTYPTCGSLGIGSGTAFVTAKVRMLTPPFDSSLRYSATPPSYTQPQGTPLAATTPGSPYVDALAAAWTAAPPKFQDRLCNLTMIYIDPTANAASSWGYRENAGQFVPGYSGSYNRYIGLSAALWTTPTTEMSLDAYETSIVYNLLGWDKMKYRAAIPSYVGQAILAALAHEYGHVLFYEEYSPDPTRNFSYSNFCSGNFNTSWQNPDTPPPFRGFGDPEVKQKDDNTTDNVKLHKLGFALLQGNFVKAATMLDKIYSSKGRWASALAAFSPDEDFVETFKLYILMHATTGRT
jgi:hypothetical protein